MIHFTGCNPPATSSYLNRLGINALTTSTENDQQGAVQDASQSKVDNNYNHLKHHLALRCMYY